MIVNDLKERLENKTCHIHKQQPKTNSLENGNLKINTCCLFFKTQLHLLVKEQEEKSMGEFPAVWISSIYV